MAVDSTRSPLTAVSPAGPTEARVSFAAVEGATELFTPAFVDYLVFLHIELPESGIIHQSRPG